MEYAILTAALWGVLVSFWLDAERRAAGEVNAVTVTVVGRDLVAVVETS